MPFISDCKLLDGAIKASSQPWSDAQKKAVSGCATWATCNAWIGSYATRWIDPKACPPQVPASAIYDRVTNPTGVRCTLQDYTVSISGRRADGFANRPLDDVGIQYGLKALQSGAINAAQFVDLNAKIGSHDIDFNWQPTRAAADYAALRTIYRSGLSNQANQLDQVAIIDIRGPEPAGIHHEYRSWVMRARLDRANGHYDNQAIWFGPLPAFGDVSFAAQYFDAMDRGLAAVEADKSHRPLAQKIVGNRPHEARDRCANGAGVEVPCVPTTDASPRIVAGQPFTDDIDKCRLKAPSAGSFGGVVFSDAQWEQRRPRFRMARATTASPAWGSGRPCRG